MFFLDRPFFFLLRLALSVEFMYSLSSTNNHLQRRRDIMALSYAGIKGKISEREIFTGNSMTAEYVQNEYASLGRLPTHDASVLRADIQRAKDNADSVYVIYSYATPIAWAYGNTVRVPEVKYSVTTSKQQSLVRGYLR